MRTTAASLCPRSKSTGNETRFRAFLVVSSSKKGQVYSITERMVPELISVLCSHSAGDVSHKPGGRLPLLNGRPAVALATLKRAAVNFAAW